MRSLFSFRERARGVAPPTLLLPYECTQVEDNLHRQGLFSCFTVKDLYLLLSALWPFGLRWYKLREKKTKRVGGGVGRRAGSSPTLPPREEEAGSTAHGAQLRGRGPEFRMLSSVWAKREPTPSPPQPTRGNRAFNSVKLRPVSLLPTPTGGPRCAYLSLVPRG
jgi:hypothetical protein